MLQAPSDGTDEPDWRPETIADHAMRGDDLRESMDSIYLDESNDKPMWGSSDVEDAIEALKNYAEGGCEPLDEKALERLQALL
jgi:hypothetical protein